MSARSLFLLSAARLSLPTPRNSHGIISFADPHPLNLAESYRYKNHGGRGALWKILHLRLHAPLTHLESTLVRWFTNVDSNGLTGKLNRLDATLMKKQGEGGPAIVNQESEKDSCPEEHRDGGSLFPRPRIAGQANFKFQFSSFSIWRVTSIRHGADFFFHFGDIHHDDGVPRAAIEEAAVGAFAEAFLAADALDGVNLDAPERRIVLVRHPEHTVFHRAVLDAGRRARAAGAALGNDGKFFGFLLARGGDSLGARLVLQLVGHHSGRFCDIGCVSHLQRFYLECQALASAVLRPVCLSPSVYAEVRISGSL